MADWLDEVVAEKAADDGLSAHDMDDDDKLDAIGERLDRMARRGDRGAIRRPRDDYSREPRRRVESSHEDTRRARDLLESAVARFENRAAKTEERTAKAFESVASWIERSQEDRREERETLREVADKIASIENRVDRANAPKPAAARPERDADIDARLERLAKRVAPPARPRPEFSPDEPRDFEAAIARRRAETALPPVESPEVIAERVAERVAAKMGDRETIRAMAAKIEALEKRATIAEAPRRPREPVSMDIDPPIRAMAAKLDALEKRTVAAEAPRRAPAPIAAPRAPVAAEAPRAKGGWRNFGVDVAEGQEAEAPAEALRGEISALSARLDRLRVAQAERRTSPDAANDLRAGVASMARSVADIAPRNGAVAIEGAVGDLGHSLSAARDAGANPYLLEPVEAMLRQVLETLRDHDPQAAAAGLERELRTLAGKVEALAGASVNPGQLDAIRRQTDDIRNMLAAAAKTPVPVERLERQIGALAERVERLAHNPAPNAEIAQVLQLLADAHSQIEQSTPAAALTSIERRLEQLAGRIDEAIRRPAPTLDMRPLEDLARRVEGVRASVERQSGPRPEAAALESALRDINAKLDRVSPGEAGSQAIMSTLQGLTARLEEAFRKPQTAVVDARPMEELARRIEGVRASVEKQGDFGVRAAKLEAALGDISQKLDRPLAPAPEAKALNLALKDLTAKLDEAFRRPPTLAPVMDARPLDDLARRLDDIHAAVENQAQRQVDPSRLEQGLREVSAKLDEAFRRPASAVAAFDSKPLDDLARRLDDIRAAVVNPSHSRSDSPGLEAALAEVSAKLDRQALSAEDSSALIEVIQDLAIKIERGASARVDLAPLENLLRGLGERPVEIDTGPIESLLRDLSDRVSANQAPVAMDTRPIENLLSRVDAKLDQVSRPSVDTFSIELALRELSDKLDGAPASGGGGYSQAIEETLQALHAKLDNLTVAHSATDMQSLELAIHELREKLEQRDPAEVDPLFVEQAAGQIAKRLEQRAAGIDADALINQISEIHGRLDSLNISASSNATLGRTVADLIDELETTQKIVQSAAARPATGVPLESGLEELRAGQIEAGRRLETRLASVQDVLQKLVDRLTEEEDEEFLAPRAVENDRAAAPAPTAPKPRAVAAMASVSESQMRDIPDRPADLPARPSSMARAEEDSQFLLEPGAGPARRAEAPAVKPGPKAAAAAAAATKKAALNAHIAAARRAAQSAMSDAVDSGDAAAPARKIRLGNFSAAGVMRQAQDMLANRRRPLLLGGAALAAVAATTLAYVEFRGGHQQPVQKSELSSPIEAPAVAAADKEAKPSSEAKSNVDDKTAKAAALDNTPTGAVTTAAPKPAVAAAPLTKPAPADLVAALPATLPQALRDAATAGDMGAQTEVAIRLLDGRGAARDPKAASRWFELAATQGLPVAQYRLGAIYEKGVGVPRDLAMARAWYTKAANAGNARAMHNLAVVFAEDAGSGKPDYAEATRWFRKAGEYGVRDSQFNLGVLYGRGLGVPQDFAQSWVWFSLAAKQGDVDAGKKREEVAAKLDAAGLAAATKSLADFKALTPSPEANEAPGPAGGWEPKAAAPQATRAPVTPTVKG